MKKIYKIPVNNMSEKEAKKCLHTMKKKYQQTIAWEDIKQPLGLITYYIEMVGLKPKQTIFYKLSKYSISSDIFILELNIKLFNRLKKISKITNTVNKEVEFINDLIKHKIDIMDYLREEMVKATKIPSKYFTIVDYPSLITSKKSKTKNIFEKLSKMMTKLKKDKK